MEANKSELTSEMEQRGLELTSLENAMDWNNFRLPHASNYQSFAEITNYFTKYENKHFSIHDIVELADAEHLNPCIVELLAAPKILSNQDYISANARLW